MALFSSSHSLFAQPGAFPNNVIKPGCEGNSLRQYVVSTYNPNNGLVTYITRITITCPSCSQWHDPSNGNNYYSCDTTASLLQSKTGLCPPCVNITFDELLQHYIVSYWPFGVTQPIIYYTLTWDETPIPGGGTDITFDPIDPE